MISEKMEKAFNDQINAEMYSAYLYLSMHAYVETLGLKGFSNWMYVQTQEEMAHAMGLYNYVLTRGGKIDLGAIEKPQGSWNNIVDVAKAVLEHERKVTGLINGLVDVAEEQKDRAAIGFLDWYVKEQVEEEDNVETMLTRLNFIGSDVNALLNYDKELAARTFVAPVIG